MTRETERSVKFFFGTLRHGSRVNSVSSTNFIWIFFEGLKRDSTENADLMAVLLVET